MGMARAMRIPPMMNSEKKPDFPDFSFLLTTAADLPIDLETED